MDALVRELVAAGWKRKRGKRHVKLLSPDGKTFIVAAVSPSDRRALTNMKALVKRVSKR